MIQEVILENFKSYYGEHRIMCGSHFNCIIGPNGSGKSNFIDAIQFVFGKRPTAMRCKQINQLISQGQKECRVEVIFNNFTLKRIGKQQTTEVFINNQAVKQGKLQQFLKENKIDATNKFIILQGEVESISMMKPKSGNFDQPGLLEYLEEELSKEQMEEAYKEMLTYQSNSFQSSERAKIARQTLDEVKSRVDLNDFVQKIYQRLFRIQIFSIEIQQKQNFKKQLEDQLHNLMISQNYEIETFDTLIREHQDLKFNKDKLEQQINTIQEQLKSIQLEISFLNKKAEQEDLLNCQIEITKKEQEIEKLGEQLESLLYDQKRYEQNIPDKQNKLDKLLIDKNIAEEYYNKLIDGIKIESKILYGKKAELESQMKPTLKQIKEFEEKLEELFQECKKTEKDSNQYLNELLEIDNKCNQLQAQHDQIGLSLSKSQATIKLIGEVKEQSQQQLQQLKIEEKKLVEDISQKENRLLQNNEEAEEKNQQNSALRLLFKAQQTGQLNINGRLGDLGTIDEKYECAITTACPGLDSIVVDTEEEALKCIEFLKENKIGRTTFLPINRVPESVTKFMNQPYRNVDNRAQRLFDLIQLKDSKYKGVFYNMLRDTLVVDNIEIAREIGINKRKRVVTLDGKLIDQSGVMSGGGQPKKGGMIKKIFEQLSTEEREEILKAKDISKQLLGKTKVEINKLEVKLKEMIKDEEAVNLKIKLNTYDKQILQEQLNELQNKKEETTQQLKTSHLNQQKNQQIQSEMFNIKNQLQKLEEFIAPDKELLEKYEKQIQLIANQDINNAKQTFTNTMIDYENAEAELLKAQAQKNVVAKKILQVEQTILDEKQSVQQLRFKLRKLQEFKNKEQSDINDLKERQREFEENNQNLSLTFNELNNQCEKLKKEINTFEKSIKEKDEEKQRIQIKISIEKKDADGYLTRQQELIQEHIDYFTSFETSNSSLFFNFIESNLFSQNLSKEIQTVRGKYLQKLNEYFLGNAIEFLPTQIPQEIQLINDLEKYYVHIQKLLDVHNELYINEDKNQDKSIIRTYLHRSNDYEQKDYQSTLDENKYNSEKARYDDLYQQRRTKFEYTLQSINEKLKEIYSILSIGGEIALEVIDSLDIFKEGVMLQVKPKGKTWKSISKLSGGEKTLASLSLMLAMHFYKPTPIYILDEIDAALDVKNVGIVSNYLYSIKSTNMFDKAQVLIGLYMKDGAQSTDVVSLQIADDEIEQRKNGNSTQPQYIEV